jgi:hypothetical protein
MFLQVVEEIVAEVFAVFVGENIRKLEILDGFDRTQCTLSAAETVPQDRVDHNFGRCDLPETRESVGTDVGIASVIPVMSR